MAKIRNPIIMVGGGTDISDTTAVASDVLSGKDFYLANGTKTTGTIQTYSGSTTITQNGTVATSGKYLSSDLTVSVGGGASIINSQDVSTTAVGAVTANNFVSKVDGYVNYTPTTQITTLNAKNWYQLSSDKAIILTYASSPYNATLALIEKNGNGYSIVNSVTYSSQQGIYQGIVIVKDSDTQFTVFYGNSASTVQYYYFRFTLINNVLTITTNETIITGVTGSMNYHMDVARIDTDRYLLVTPTVTKYYYMLDLANDTYVRQTMGTSRASYGGCKILDINSTRALVLHNRYSNYNDLGQIVRADFDLVNNTMTITAIYTPANANVIPSTGSWVYLFSYVKKFDNYTFFIFFGLYCCKLVFSNDFSSVTTSTRIVNNSNREGASYYELTNGDILILQTANASTKYAYLYHIDSGGNLTYSTSSSSVSTADTRCGLLLTSDENAFISVEFTNNRNATRRWLIQSTPSFMTGATMLGSNTDTIYGVSKTGGSNGDSITVMIPNVT